MKSTEAEQARRVNLTISLFEQSSSPAEVLAKLVARYGLSRRQAYRYLQQAQQAGSPMPVPETKSGFTVKLPRRLIAQVRQRARQQRCSISSWVEQTLRVGLDKPTSHG